MKLLFHSASKHSLKEDSLRNKLCYAVSLEIDYSSAALYPWPTNSLYYITQNTFLQKYAFFLFRDIKLSAVQLLNNDVQKIIVEDNFLFLCLSAIKLSKKKKRKKININLNKLEESELVSHYPIKLITRLVQLLYRYHLNN